MYSLTLCYSAPYGDKIHNFLVNGVDQGQFSCAKTGTGEWVEISLGSVKLNAGDNDITIKSSWGWTDIDYITVESASLPTISASDVTCCDANATAETQSLMSYLSSVYGEHILSGQQEIYKYGPHDFEYEFDYIENLTGELPAIRGFDYLNCNPLYGSEDGTNERIINWVKNKNGIATASWHITVPKDFDSYTLGDSVAWADSTYVPSETNFDTSQAVIEGTKEYEYYMLCLKGLAAQLQELQDEGIPLIFRPLHEAEGGGGESGSWFWWGKSGSAVYKQLWILTYKTLTETYGLHNIIWEWNSYAYNTSENWYPGDEYVDLIAYDKYNCTDWSTGSAVLTHNDSAISSTFYTIMEKYNSKKMVAMAENDSIPTVSNLITEKAGWLYFLPWYDGGSDSTNFLSNELFNTKEDLIEMYQSDYCITLGELPADLYSTEVQITTTTAGTGTTSPTTTTTTVAAAETTTTEPEEFVFDTKKYSVTLENAGVEDAVLTITIEGAPTASIVGCLGYSVGKDWENIEWSGNADADGVLTVDIPLADIPEGTTSAEIQIWWSNVWDSATESSTDADCDMTDYTETVGTAQTTTTTTATEPATETQTTTSTEPATEATSGNDALYGDADLDGTVSISDAVRIMSYDNNSAKYPLSDEALNNADVYMRGDGVNNMDALSVQKYSAQLLSELPESYQSDSTDD
jgi:mannan endo-1,4-beta-mannosidase